jgi:Lon protease-like protein
MSFLDRYKSTADLPARLPVFPLPSALLLPRAELPLNIFEPRYLQMVSDAMAGDRMIGMIQPADDSADLMARPKLCSVGCAGRITSYAETPDSRILITLTGVCRFQVESELITVTPYRSVDARYDMFAGDLIAENGQELVDRAALLKAFRDYLNANDLRADWEQVLSASTESLVNTLSLLSPNTPREKQALLEAADLKTRADVLIALTEIALSKRSKGGETRRLQ